MPPSQGVKRARTRRTRSDVSLDALTEVVGLSAKAGPSPRSGPAPKSGAPVGRRPAAETSRGGTRTRTAGPAPLWSTPAGSPSPGPSGQTRSPAIRTRRPAPSTVIRLKGRPRSPPARHPAHGPSSCEAADRARTNSTPSISPPPSWRSCSRRTPWSRPARDGYGSGPRRQWRAATGSGRLLRPPSGRESTLGFLNCRTVGCCWTRYA